jgi:hypothetical protein
LGTCKTADAFRPVNYARFRRIGCALRAYTAARTAAYAVCKRDRKLGFDMFAFRIVTPDAAQRTSLEEYRRPDTRTVIQRIAFKFKH